MSEEEKRQQKAQLLLECVEAEEELAHLIERATSLSHSLNEVAGWLSDLKKDVPAMILEGNRGRDARVRTAPQYRDAMNFDQVEAIVNGVHATRDRLRELQQRKSALGLK